MTKRKEKPNQLADLVKKLRRMAEEARSEAANYKLEAESFDRAADEAQELIDQDERARIANQKPPQGKKS